jgi:hypothetical protein
MGNALLALRIIRDLCDAPYWETKRRNKIREIAEAALVENEKEVKKIPFKYPPYKLNKK